MADITLPARILFSLGPIPITDGFLGAVLVTLLLFGFMFAASRKFAIVPTRMQTAFEMVTEYILEQLETAFGDRKQAEDFYPLFMTLLLFIAVANQLMLLPFVFEITLSGGDLFRQPTSDLAQPLALSLLIFVLSNVMALRISPMKHLSNFINIGPLLKVRSIGDLFSAMIEFSIGLLNIVGEFAKVVSLAARLFGNIFAGNVMVAVIISLSTFTQFIVPIPFLVLSIFSGFVQAFVFMLLSIQFTALAIQGAKTEEEELTETVPA